MKVSMAAVSFLLLLSITVALGSKNGSSSTPCISNEHPDLSLLPSFSSGGPYHPAECCLTYVSRPVPRQRVSSYYETSSQCPKPGIVFITKKGHYICANPRDGWVQDYIKELEE
ncbi:C-C motif chemokine 14 [Bos mutus]|uniref:C-C motif chemokine 14 n=1 Tax=Bos mutus TaxID=72004 RepID=L8IBG1_9CETA|nr:C-C motif chemokine 14 [Bos mutus]